jgi:glycosyltransferase involved in cell wall biosynthesis
MRVAFVTPEYVTEEPRRGGLASYLRRMATALAQQGHHPEIFVTSRTHRGRSEADGVLVHFVAAAQSRRPVRAALRILGALRAEGLARTLCALVDAAALAAALRRRCAEVDFDLVQSTNLQAVGLFVRPRGAAGLGRRVPHLTRCSNDDREIARRNGVALRSRAGLDVLVGMALRRADVLYAPSRFLARHLERQGLRVHTLAPPALLEVKPAPARPPGLPARYFVHFGQLTRLKGVPLLADAMQRACEREPGFSMVWAGSDPQGLLAECLERLGPHRARLHYAGELERPALYALVADAEAAVFATSFDNLPNTVIESLLLGVPVIACADSSVEELVAPGVNGSLVPQGDAGALADAMLAQWRGDTGVRRRVAWQRPDMRPEAAVSGLLELAGLAAD